MYGQLLPFSNGRGICTKRRMGGDQCRYKTRRCSKSIIYKIMAELGIDISHHKSESVNKYLKENFTLIATVCDNARESCPVFTGDFIHTIHYGFNDPAKAIGNHLKIITIYRQVRGEIRTWVEKLNKDYM